MSSKYRIKRAAEQFVLSEESAQAQVVEFLTYYDIDPERSTDEQQSERTLDALRDYIRAGKVAVRRGTGNKLEVVHTLESGTEVVYSELSAAAKLAMDRCPPQANYARIYELMGSLSNLGRDGIEKYQPRDLSVVDILGPLFMAA